MNATVAVATFGDTAWADLARERAIPSAEAQGCPVIHRHADTLAEARNEALAAVETEWVAYLDADDEFSPSYLDAMATGTADVRAPAISYVKNGNPRPPYVPRVAGHDHDCTADCLPAGNFICIGAAVRTALAREVGGFKDWPVYEDWCFFQRCWLAGGTVEAIPDAIYLAHWRRDSRNRAPDMASKNRVHHEIVAANLGGA